MNIIDEKRKDHKIRSGVIAISLLVSVCLLCIVLFLNQRSTSGQQQLLKESIENQLISISVAARDILDTDAIARYQTPEDVENDWEHFVAVRSDLRDLAGNTGADYIYVLKYIDGKAMFIMDTDEEDESIFIPYELSRVHREAFLGHTSSGVMNVTDAYGSYNTAALPILKDGKVIAIICTDIEDTYYASSERRARDSAILLIGVLGVVLTGVIILIILLLRRIGRMQNQLRFIAHHDTVTGLPNRQYLLDLLDIRTRSPVKKPFALVFIDLDNFKTINDRAGHDTGDEVLKKIGAFLESGGKTVHSFRPSAGRINIAARVGGDEFIQIVDDIETEEAAAHLAKDLFTRFSDGTFASYRDRYGLGLSIGIALYPLHTESYHVLIKYADIAMYHAKHNGKNSYRIYEADMEPKNEK